MREISRTRSTSRRAKIDVSGGRFPVVKRRMEGIVIAMLTAAIWLPLVEGEGFRLPQGGEWLIDLVFAAAGLFILYWYNNPRAKEVEADPYKHRPWIDRVETSEVCGSKEGVIATGRVNCRFVRDLPSSMLIDTRTVVTGLRGPAALAETSCSALGEFGAD